jgi:hypothetical protein
VRPLDPHFAPDEELYLRFSHARLRPAEPQYGLAQSVLSADAIRIRDCQISVNRQKYSPSPESVLLDPPGEHNGIAVTTVGRLPQAVPGRDAEVYDCRPVDAPLPDNPAHANIAIHLAQQPFDPAREIPAGARKRIKESLASVFSVYRLPTPA